MHVLFPSDPLVPRQVEADFALQAQAAQDAEFTVLRVDHDALARGDIERALRFVATADQPQAVLYRGWMLRENTYAGLYDGLLQRGLQLINTPAAYASCHQLPGWYELLHDVTPRSVWVALGEDERTVEPLPWAKIWEALAPFGNAPLVLKDYVKSRKHEWHEACFIPSASDHSAVERVTRRFVAGQAESLVGGLVYREWLPFKGEGTDSHGMPLIQEGRWWILDDEPFFVTSQIGGRVELRFLQKLILDLARRVAKHLHSRFYTLDMAQLPNGDWRVIELGDGQVSGLPTAPNGQEIRFYQALSKSSEVKFPWLTQEVIGFKTSDVFASENKDRYWETFFQGVLPSSGDS